MKKKGISIGVDLLESNKQMLLHQRYKNIKYKLKISECDFQYLNLSVVESLVNIFSTSKRGNNIPLL